jgi:hypothetical protein
VRLFNESLRFDERKQEYEIGWPYKPNAHLLSDNRRMALAQTIATYHRLKKRHDGILYTYHGEIVGLKERGSIEEVPPEEINSPLGPEYTMPHRPVETPDKETTKTRPVFNASSAPRDGYSLNDCLYRGPNLIPDSTGVLLRTRLYDTLLSGDIAKAFHTIH